MKRIICILMCVSMFLTIPVFAEENITLELNSKSAILLDKNGTVIFEKNSTEKRAPASVTKIMTLLLTFEALDRGDITLEDMVSISENASKQGGTQVFLEAGEQISVNDLIKSISVSSANDAAMAMAEYLKGTKESFVELMNKRAKELSMNDTTFKNPTGLTEEGHLTSASDIAKMSVELLKHEKIYDYTTIWMDSIRNGEFELANTNKMLKTYNGLIGLKTGFTSEALYCISAVAKRDSEEFIAVVMGAETSDNRSEDITKMLDYAFANYKTEKLNVDLQNITVINGKKETLQLVLEDKNGILVSKNSDITSKINLPENVSAPIKQGDILGDVIFYDGDNEITKTNILANEEVEEINFGYILLKFINCFFQKS